MELASLHRQLPPSTKEELSRRQQHWEKQLAELLPAAPQTTTGERTATKKNHPALVAHWPLTAGQLVDRGPAPARTHLLGAEKGDNSASGQAGLPLPAGVYLRAEDCDKLRVAGDLTLTARIQTRAEVADIVCKYDSQRAERAFVFGIGGEGEANATPGSLFAWVSGERERFEGVQVYGSIPVNDGKPHHVALVFRGGESIDLSIVLEGLELDTETRQALVPMLEQYAASIDGHIQARTSFLHEASPAISDTIGEGSWNRMRAIIQQEADVRARLRDENLGWFESFSLVLPEESRPMFQESVRLSQFGNIWRPGRLERMLEAALQMDDLEEEQFAAIESMEQPCIGSLVPLKSRVEAAYRFESPSQWVIDQQQKWVSSFNGAVVDPRIEGEAGREARDGLAKAEQACMKSLEDILGDRYSSLPGARNTPRRDGPSSGRSSESQRRRDELYKRFDRNGDGRLDADERAQMRREFQRERGRP